jgi:twitching motility protein PilJ
MVSATEYQRAVEAFAQEQYEEAARLFGSLVESRPADPNLRLWLASAQQQIGHQDLAREQYEVVLGLTSDPEILQTAQKALQRIDIDLTGGSYTPMAGESSIFGGSQTNSKGLEASDSVDNDDFNFDLESFESANFNLDSFDSLPTPELPEEEEFKISEQDIRMLEEAASAVPNNEQFNLDFGGENDSAAMLGEPAPMDRPPTRIPTRVPTATTISMTEPPSSGWLADSSLGVKQALGIGALVISTVAGVNGAVYYTVLNSGLSEAQQTALQSNALTGGLLGAGVIGAATLAITWLLNRSVVQPIQQLQITARQVAEGDVDARFEPKSGDEVGKLAATFNKMAADLQRGIGRAEEEMSRQQRDKEQLQEEIIHLLDQVEGASRGDLTVKAEVSASLTGAVADAFNVTIASLHKIIVQVKQSVQKVNQAALDSESFARGLSKEALRQAQEISTSRQSVQEMTKSIQQVAENARRAESVARQASQTATRGGDAVDRTVQGILSLRETVSETGKKVKRLAESTQEISKIVALINQLSSRTNLLALNASIEAVRAGEAGRGFAIVADEVRQLADRAAKATREIEQIVLNIQSETGAVMQAMEKGTQQVVIGTQLAEEAKQSLDEIIQVSTQIDGLVAEIAQETVAQEKISTDVAAVMETVEVSAQATSSESRRVSDALQGLVLVAQDLRDATDRFQVESAE